MIFPDLAADRLTRILLRGTLSGDPRTISRYFKRKKKVSYLSFDAAYTTDGHRHHRRLCFDLSRAKYADMIIDVTTGELPKLPATGSISEKDFIRFCTWLKNESGLKENGFRLTATMKVPFSNKLNLPFDPKSGRPIAVTGIKFSVSPPNVINEIFVELHDNDVILSSHTRPHFHLNPKVFNDHFFDAIVEVSKRALTVLGGNKGGI